MSSGGTVQFDIGGYVVKVLEQTIRAKPDTLLCTMLDDPGRGDKSEPIFVEGNPRLADHIISWYRYGRILLPASVSIDDMRRECGFFQLPDDVTIKRENAAAVVRDAAELMQAARKRSAEAFHDAKRRALAAKIFHELVNQKDAHRGGRTAYQACDDKSAKHVMFSYTAKETPQIAAMATEIAQEFGWTVTGRNDYFQLKKGPSSST